MIELSVFPKTFFGVEVPKDLNERVLNVVKGLDYSYDHFPHPLTTDTNIHELPELDFYIDYLNEQIFKIKEKQNLSCDKLSIFTMWANKSTAGRYSARHNHPMSWWSFIHYLTEGSATHFFDHHAESPWMQLGENNNTKRAFRIVQLDEHVPEHIANFKQDYNRIKQVALQAKQQRMLDKWLKKARKDMYVEYKISIPNQYKNESL